MGAPKQKWSDKEEVALKAGVAKHGAGRWRTILEDPEFSSELYLRSNVDLKDKWRNMSAMINGLGSRATARQALKRVQQAPKMKHECRILLSDENIIPTMVCIEGMQKGSSSGPTVDKDEKTALSKSQHDLRSMTPAVMAAAVAQAVAEADTAIAAAEEALRVAEAAEANAEAIKAFADAAMMTLNGEPLEGW